jgi:hypothetical protein
MWRKKKVILAVLLAVVVLVGGTAGIVLAQDNNGDGSQSKFTAGFGTDMDRVCAIYQEKTGVAIDSEVLKEAFAQAQQERQDKALDDRLQKMVEDGTITPEQAEQYKTWLGNRPSMESMEQYREQLREWMQNRPDIPQDWKNWQNTKPEMPMPGQFKRGFDFRGFGGARGMPGIMR